MFVNLSVVVDRDCSCRRQDYQWPSDMPYAQQKNTSAHDLSWNHIAYLLHQNSCCGNITSHKRAIVMHSFANGRIRIGLVITTVSGCDVRTAMGLGSPDTAMI